MVYLVYKTEKEAQAVCDKFTALFCPSPSGKTTIYAEPRKHPTLAKYAVPMMGNTMEHLSDEEIESLVSLDTSWTPVEEEII